jgi:type IV secretory pathway VirB10-like protein
MKKDHKHTDPLDQLFDEKLDNYQAPVSIGGAWGALKAKLAMRSFLRFNPGSLNIYYALLATATISLGTIAALTEEKNKAANHLIKTEQQEATQSKEPTEHKQEERPTAGHIHKPKPENKTRDKEEQTKPKTTTETPKNQQKPTEQDEANESHMFKNKEKDKTDVSLNEKTNETEEKKEKSKSLTEESKKKKEENNNPVVKKKIIVIDEEEKEKDSGQNEQEKAESKE